MRGFYWFFFFIFIAGYFLGKKNAAEQFLYKIEQESLADQIYSSMCILSDKEDDNENGDESSEIVDVSDDAEAVEGNDLESNNAASVEQISMVAAEPKEYYTAQLAGFGSEAAATRFAQSLKKKGYAVEVVERFSIGTQGKKVIWYQVVTKKYEQKSELMTVVNIIKKAEHLKDVKIVQA